MTRSYKRRPGASSGERPSSVRDARTARQYPRMESFSGVGCSSRARSIGRTPRSCFFNSVLAFRSASYRGFVASDAGSETDSADGACEERRKPPRCQWSLLHRRSPLRPTPITGSNKDFTSVSKAVRSPCVRLEQRSSQQDLFRKTVADDPQDLMPDIRL